MHQAFLAGLCPKDRKHRCSGGRKRQHYQHDDNEPVHRRHAFQGYAQRQVRQAHGNGSKYQGTECKLDLMQSHHDDCKNTGRDPPYPGIERPDE